MGSQVMNFTARDLASILGRNQGPELFFQQPFAALTSPIVPKALPLNRPMERIHIVWRGNVNIAGANYVTVAAEAPQTIINRIRLTGTHRQFKALTPIDLPGATAFAWNRMFRQRASSMYINGVRQPELNVPLGQVPATFGNIGSYNLEIHYDIPVVPILPASAKLTGVPFLYFQEDWQDTLQLQLFFGDATSFGNPGAAVVTFGAFGTPGVGAPTVSIFQNFEILGPLAPHVSPAVVVRNSQTVTQGLGAVANNVRLALLQKQKTMNVVFKTGLLQAAASAGVSVFATMLDGMLEQTQIIVDNKPVRNNFNNFAEKEYAGYAFDTVLPGGYNNFSFVDSLNPLTYYRGDLLPGGASFELDSAILTANAQNAVEVIQEQVYGDPQGGLS